MMSHKTIVSEAVSTSAVQGWIDSSLFDVQPALSRPSLRLASIVPSTSQDTLPLKAEALTSAPHPTRVSQISRSTHRSSQASNQTLMNMPTEVIELAHNFTSKIFQMANAQREDSALQRKDTAKREAAIIQLAERQRDDGVQREVAALQREQKIVRKMLNANNSLINEKNCRPKLSCNASDF